MYRVKEFAALIGKSPSTLRRWDSEGRLKPKRSVGNQRYYTDADLQKALNIETETQIGKTVVYCRVSSNNQKPELEHQIKAMEEFCLGRGECVDEWISEVGGGLNFKRKKFLSLMKDIRLGKVSKVIIAHKDRLVRFSFEFIEEFASWYGCSIIVANQESLSPEEEMVKDLMSIIHTFSCRLYGLRSYKKQIKEIASISIDSKIKS